MGMISLLIVILFLSPIFCGILSLYFIIVKYQNNFDTILAFVFLGLSFGCINVLKVPESDLLNYIEFYINAGKYDFINYLKIEDKEYLFFSLNYFLYYVLGGSFQIYLIIFTALCYFLLFYSVRILDKHLKFGKESYFLAIIVIVLFPNIFSISAHLMRQFLAASLLIVFLIKNIFEGDKKSILFLVLSSLIHSSALLFIIILLPFFNKRMSNTNMFIFLILSLGFGLILGRFSSLFEGVPVLGYGIQRFTERDNVYETENLGYLAVLLQGITVFLFYFGIKKYKMNNFSRLYKLLYIVLFLIIFILSNYQNTQMASRFNFYIYFLFPISIYFLYSILNIREKKSKNFFNFSLISLFLFWFCFKLNYGTWKYEHIEKLFFFYL